MMQEEGHTMQHNPNKWRVMDSGSEKLAQIHTDAEGHVTVTCYCARCMARRLTDAPGTIALLEPVEQGVVTAFADGSRVPSDIWNECLNRGHPERAEKHDA